MHLGDLGQEAVGLGVGEERLAGGEPVGVEQERELARRG